MNKKKLIIITVLGTILLIGIVIAVITTSSNRTDESTTQTPSPTLIEDSRPPNPEEIETENEFYRKNSPDVYISRQLPFSNEFFSANSELIDAGNNSYFQINVTYNTDPAIAEQALIKWLLEQGLTENQISDLSITVNETSAQ